MEECFSEWVDVTSSVVQGSVLGGTLFDIYINDIRKCIINPLILLFADNTKVAQVVKDEEDRRKMQSLIDKLQQWAETWGITFNASKCKIMHVGFNNPGIQYTMNGTQIATNWRVKRRERLGSVDGDINEAGKAMH